MNGFGRTWWGKRWLRTLEQLGLTYPDHRMSKARSLVHKEAVDLLTVDPGQLSAWVDEPRKSFGVSVWVPTFSTQQWQAFDAVCAARLGNLAALLDDQLPSGIDKQLQAHGLTLFPADGEIDAECPCRDRSRTCVHVIAAQHAFAAWFDDDPFLLPLLRGRRRQEVLDGARTAREPLATPAGDDRILLSDLPTEGFYSARGSLDAALHPR